MATETAYSRPQLRSDLVIEMQGEGKEQRYLIIDPASGRYFQCGSSQHALLALCTGTFTNAEIIARYCAQTHILLRSEQLDAALRKLEGLGFLVQNDQVSIQTQPDAPPLIAPRNQRPWRFSKRWRLFSVQSMLRPLEAYTRWFFSPVFLGLCLLLALTTTWILLHGGWSQGMAPILIGLYIQPSLLTWGPFLLTILVTAFFHENAHALALQHFGRKPGYFGVGISFPVGVFFYAEIGEVWRLAKLQRIIVTFAGPLASLIIGAVGAFGWWLMPFNITWSPWLAALMTAGITTAVYNLFPFFRTDGYFILADWVDMPNLDRMARTYLLQTLLRPFRRQQQPTRKLSINQRLFFAGYCATTLLLTIWLMGAVGGFLFRTVVSLVAFVLHLQ